VTPPVLLPVPAAASRLPNRRRRRPAPLGSPASPAAASTPVSPPTTNGQRILTLGDPRHALHVEVCERLLGVRSTRRGLLFVQPLDLGQRVCVAGSFNNWAPDAAVLLPHDDLAIRCLLVPADPGEHRYRLLVDGRWADDAFNPDTVPNPFGSHDHRVVHQPDPTPLDQP